MSGSAASPLPYFLFAFLVYLYLPHIFFKLGAEKRLDLGRKKDSTQIEEFLSAALPSAALNMFACMFIFIPRIAIHFLIVGPLGIVEKMFSDRFWAYHAAYLTWIPGAVDWHALSGLTAFGASGGGLSLYIAKGTWWGEVSYLIWLYLVSIVNGRMYGRIVIARLDRRATKAHIEMQIISKMTKWEVFRWIVGGIFYKVWDPFYHEFHVPMFPWMARQTYVWLRTEDDKIFFGRFFNYQKTPSGDLAGMTLDNVFLYRRTETPRQLSPFVGQVYFPSSRIAELNLTSLDSFNIVRRRIAKEVSAAMSSSRDNPFD